MISMRSLTIARGNVSPAMSQFAKAQAVAAVTMIMILGIDVFPHMSKSVQFLIALP
jgi:hypothetical protein